MNRIHDALDKAIERAEQGPSASPTQNAHNDQLVANAGIRHKIDPELMRQRRIVTLNNYNAESEAFRMLRTKILKKMRENNWNSFAVTAPTQEAGKSTVSVNLAIAMAMDVNQSVLLVDLDLRHPKVHWYFGLDHDVGLRDYFLSDKPLSEILVSPGIDRLMVLPGRGQAIGSSEILSGPKMKALASELNSKRGQSRITIYDLPPVLATDDVISVSDCYDAILLVVEEGKSQPEEIKQALSLLSGKNLLGTVLNKSRNPPEHLTY